MVTLLIRVQPDSGSITAIRALGHNQLCGVLHVSWQTKYSVDGQYLICLLYGHFLILASTSKVESHEQSYQIQACIALSTVKVEDVDNGRGKVLLRLHSKHYSLPTGLQCHTAPYSWKMVFENDHQLYEITMTACSPKEELEWRSRLAERAEKDNLDHGEQAVLSSLSLKIKALGTVFGKPGTFIATIVYL
jgi:hypothetical protein